LRDVPDELHGPQDVFSGFLNFRRDLGVAIETAEDHIAGVGGDFLDGIAFGASDAEGADFQHASENSGFAHA